MKVGLSSIEDRFSGSRCPALSTLFTAIAVCVFAAGTFAQMPPPGVLVGPTVTASLRNAADATREQATIVRTTANTWARRANVVNYRGDQL